MRRCRSDEATGPLPLPPNDPPTARVNTPSVVVRYDSFHSMQLFLHSMYSFHLKHFSFKRMALDFVNSLIHAFINSSIYSFDHLVVHPYMYQSIHSCIQSSIHAFNSFMHRDIRSFIHPYFSSIHPFIHPSFRPSISPLAPLHFTPVCYSLGAYSSG